MPPKLFCSECMAFIFTTNAFKSGLVIHNYSFASASSGPFTCDSLNKYHSGSNSLHYLNTVVGKEDSRKYKVTTSPQGFEQGLPHSSLMRPPFPRERITGVPPPPFASLFFFYKPRFPFQNTPIASGT